MTCVKQDNRHEKKQSTKRDREGRAREGEGGEREKDIETAQQR